MRVLPVLTTIAAVAVGVLGAVAGPAVSSSSAVLAASSDISHGVSTSMGYDALPPSVKDGMGYDTLPPTVRDSMGYDTLPPRVKQSMGYHVGGAPRA